MILVVCPNPSVDTLMGVGTFKPTAVNRARSEEHYPGGKGVHVAMAAAEFGEKVCLLGFWGGPTGTWIKQQCTLQGIECLGPFLEQWNRFCITISQDGPFNETELLGSGPSLEQGHVDDCYTAFEAKLEEASIVVLSGSLPPQCPVDFYKNLIQRAHACDKKCLIDTTGEALEQAMEAKPMGIHLNEHESQQVTGTSDIGQIMNHLSKYSNLQIITQGAKGLFLGTSGDIFHANIKLNQVLTTVGSGDCLVSGIALAICKGYDNLDKVKLGVAFGAANCLRKELGMLYKKDIDLLLPQIKVDKSVINYG